uniref:HSP90 n=1 Tax=Whitmania pigra TaxID=486152 RepID=A0A8A2HEK1_WHIPI|nr:HSP90 [Whitmania pigra]
MGSLKHSLIFIVVFAVFAHCQEVESDTVTVEEDIGKSRDGSRTDDEVVSREEEAIKLDGLSVAQMKELQEKAEKHTFQAEVDRMMKLIINSLYKNKEIFLRELISNASDALDKIRFLSLTDNSALKDMPELSIRIKADKDNHVLHVTDTGIGMTKEDLIKNLGTIAKSGTSEFLKKMGEASSPQETSDLIGQFGVGFYSSFLVADKVVVTSKHNNDEQYIWESDASTFSVVLDPRGNTLNRGTTVSLHLKEEAHEYLEAHRIKDLIKKYSQFINFPIYLWESKLETVDEPDDVAEEPKSEEVEDEDGKVEDESEPKKKKVEKTIWDWVLTNESKPIWTKKPSEVQESDYFEFYRSFTKDSESPLAYSHFTAEGEVTFNSILYIPRTSPVDMFQNYGKKYEFIKMFVRRVFITDNFEDMVPKYLSFLRGVVDSDDLPLNVSRETLQQHKLLKVIKKKLVRKALDMIKKLNEEDYKTFWKEYSTNMKLGTMEDPSNRTRLAKLLRFYSSNSATEFTSLAEYVERMKEKQEHIYFIAGTSRLEVERSPFVERLLKKGYEVLYLVEAVDEYCIQSLPEFEGKKFQNAAKEGLKLDESEKAKEKREELVKEFEPMMNWLKDEALKDKIEKVVITERLTTSPCALVASSFGWSGNMERIMKSQAYQKANDANNQFYANQKKTLEINPYHPLIKELRRRVDESMQDETTKDLAVVLFETATLRSGYSVADSAEFAGRIERMLRLSLKVPLDEQIEEVEDLEDAEDLEEKDEDVEDEDDKSSENIKDEHEAHRAEDEL